MNNLISPNDKDPAKIGIEDRIESSSSVLLRKSIATAYQLMMIFAF